jgi:hypothetical protein
MSERRLRVLTAQSIVSYRLADGAPRASDTAARRRSGCERAWPGLSARVGVGMAARTRARQTGRVGGCRLDLNWRSARSEGSPRGRLTAGHANTAGLAVPRG